MKKMLCFVITLLVIITCSPSVLTSGEEIRTNDAVKAFTFSDVNRVRGSVGIKFKSDVPASRVYEILQSLCLRAYKTRSADSVAEKIDYNSRYTVQEINVPDEYVADTVLKARTYTEVVCAEPGYVWHPDTAMELEDYPEYSYDPGLPGQTNSLWHLQKIKAKEAWDYGFAGSDSVKVAVLDTGYKYHSDVDDHIAHSLAYNVIDNSTNVTDSNGHGTFIAGIIGAMINDAGINGICPNVSIIPIKVYDGSNNPINVCIARGVEEANIRGASVANVSFMCAAEWDGYGLLTSAISDFGKLVVFSAGNGGKNLTNDSNNTGKVNDYPNWVLVGGSNINDQRYYNSNYNSTYVDLFAPGEGVYSLNLSGGYSSGSGTSYAAPMVTAAVALIAAKATHLTPIQIKQYLIDNVTPVDGFDQLCVAGGILNISATVLAIYNENRGAYSRGDVNGNGTIDPNDYLIAKRAYLGTYTPTAAEIDIMDINRNGVVDSNDYLYIQRYYFRTYYFPPV